MAHLLFTTFLVAFRGDRREMKCRTAQSFHLERKQTVSRLSQAAAIQRLAVL